MDTSHFDFQHMDHIEAGRFAPEHIRQIMSSQFSDLDLTMEARNHFAHELGTGRPVTGRDFYEAIREAHSKGLITEERAMQMRDRVKLPRELV